MADKLKDRSERNSILADLHRLQSRLDRIDSEQLKSSNAHHVGRAFVYSYSYGTGERWNLYCIVERMGKDGDLYGWQFEIDTDRRVQVMKQSWYGKTLDGGSYKRIRISVFWREFDKLLKFLSKRVK